MIRCLRFKGAHDQPGAGAHAVEYLDLPVDERGDRKPFVYTIDDQRKLAKLAVSPEIAAQSDALTAKLEHPVDAVITSAAPLSEARQREMADSLKERLGRDVRITTEIDENLIGGAVIRAGDVVIDGSLRARLNGLANALTK